MSWYSTKQNGRRKPANKSREKTMQKTNLIIAALSGAALALLFIGAAENIFNLTEVLLAGGVCCAAFVYSITRG
jgi:hypothetical protein